MSDVSAAEQADAIRAEGNEIFKTRNYKLAAKKYKQALSVHPSAPVYTNRAQCYVHLNRLRDAIEDCECAIKLDKTWVRAYTRMADCYIKLDKLFKAKNTLARGLCTVPENHEMLTLLARVLDDDLVSKAKSDSEAFCRFAQASRQEKCAHTPTQAYVCTCF
jgi:tetratricopeptide (TPR) repeat protein